MKTFVDAAAATAHLPPRRSTKQLLLDSRQYAHEFRARSWWYLFSTLTLFIACTALAALPVHWSLRVIGGVLAGLVYVRLFIIYHDYQHGTILRGSRLAGFIMTAYGLFTLNPPSIWKRSHDHHHKHNAKLHGVGVGSYPLMTTDEYAAATPGQRWMYAISRHPLTMALGYVTVFLYGMSLRSFIANPREHVDSAVALVLHVILMTVLFMYGADTALFMLILPSNIAAAIGAYLFYAQHNFPQARFRGPQDWNYVSAALESSGYIRMNRLMRWFTGNIGYHHVHHLNHKIPFYRLPEAMAGIVELQSPRTTTLHPRDVLHCLRLKLYDARANRLVDFKGN